VEARLDGHEVGIHAEDCRGGGYHDDEPEVELGFGPHVFSFALEDADDGFVDHVGEGAWGWAVVSGRDEGVAGGAVNVWCLCLGGLGGPFERHLALVVDGRTEATACWSYYHRLLIGDSNLTFAPVLESSKGLVGWLGADRGLEDVGARASRISRISVDRTDRW